MKFLGFLAVERKKTPKNKMLGSKSSDKTCIRLPLKTSIKKNLMKWTREHMKIEFSSILITLQTD